MLQRFSNLITVSILLSIFGPTCATSGTGEIDVHALQVRLKQDGYYSDKVDGISGPNFHEALSQYAEDHGILAEKKEVIDHLVTRALQDELRLPTETELEKAHKEIRGRLLDGAAARFRDEYAYDIGEDILVCGEVNGKNAYGAYIGFVNYRVFLNYLDADEFMLELREDAAVDQEVEEMGAAEQKRMQDYLSSKVFAAGFVNDRLTDYLCALGASSMAVTEEQ